ncbi:hypothetical protein LY78DRAFT_227960 [Colletotrichum sublineola]|nr:hypothetical protein LY78DRAFT_227960 [Colletotrichum sublineola]
MACATGRRPQITLQGIGGVIAGRYLSLRGTTSVQQVAALSRCTNSDLHKRLQYTPQRGSP